MRILIIGAGAIGSLLGAKLALAGHTVVLVGRQPLVEAVRTSGLALSTPDGVTQIASVAAAESVADALAADDRFDLALLTVKAYDTEAVSDELRGVQRAHEFPPVLTLQNGVGNEEALAAALGADRVLSGAINTPVSVPAPGRVEVHRASYRIGLAPMAASALVEIAAETLSEAGFAVSRFADYRGLKWTKLLMNMLANASSAILDWTPAEVMAHPVSARLEAIAWQEALAVMAALRVRPVLLAGYPFPILAPVARSLPATWLARALRGFVSGGRGSKMPSLHIALIRGQPSEVGWLNGAVSQRGLALTIPTPVNACFNNLVAELTERQVNPATYRDDPDRLAAMCDRRQSPA